MEKLLSLIKEKLPKGMTAIESQQSDLSIFAKLPMDLLLNFKTLPKILLIANDFDAGTFARVTRQFNSLIPILFVQLYVSNENETIVQFNMLKEEGRSLPREILIHDNYDDFMKHGGFKRAVNHLKKGQLE